MQLAVAHVHSCNSSRAALQQHVREPSGGGADVETVATGGIDTEDVERVRKLVSAARHVRRRGLDLQRRRLVDLHAGFLVSGNSPRENECLRLRARVGQSPLDEEDVESLLHAAARRSSASKICAATASKAAP